MAVAVAANALDAPKKKVILSISGEITQTNAKQRADFDLPMIAALPQHRFVTSTPWHHGAHEFSGPLLRDLLAAVGASGTVIRTYALNDYKVDVPIADAIEHSAIVAILFDGKPMPVREKGPLFIVFPYDSSAELQTERYYSRSPWQLRRIEVK